MTAPLHRSREPARGRTDGPRRIRAHERARLIAFLDDGLRRGERGRLEAEYASSLDPRDLRGHRVVFDGSRPIAHAMLHAVEIRARQRRLGVGLIGGVYTAPEWRGRGLARRCVEACVVDAAARGLPLALLWSELSTFYAQLGFAPAGSERRIALDGAVIASARSLAAAAAQEPRSAGETGALEIGEARARDFSALEALYAAKPVHVARSAGALAKLARGPEVALRVARRGGAAIAYAACGRGDDLRGVVHEWAGDTQGVLACVAALHADCAAQLLLASAEPEGAAEALLAAGANAAPAPLALVRVLDAEALARAIGTPELAAWPLYVWGFDGI